MEKIYYNKQFLDQSDLREVQKSLKEKLITTGPYIQKLEEGLKKYLSTKNAIVCSSGTSAIFMALKSINLKSGDNIIIPAINFIASVNMSETLGANVYLADIDVNTGQMSPKNLEDCIKHNKLKKIKAVVTMYLGGSPNNVLAFYKLKKIFKFFLIEDSCHALGAKYIYNNKTFMVGCSKHCDLSTFSLHPVKSITSGEGGIVTTNNNKLASKVKLFRSHGMFKKKNTSQYWEYDIIAPGFNFRLSDINASLAYSQLKKLNRFVAHRNKLFLKYCSQLKDISNVLKVIKHDENTISAHHLMIVIINFKKLKINKDQFIQKLINNHIFPQFHYKPIYKFKYYKKLKNNYKFKNSDDYYKNALSLPLYYSLSEKHLIKITTIIKKILKKYGI